MRLFLLIAFTVLLGSTPAFASKSRAPLSQADLAAFEESRAQIEKDIKGGEKYSELDRFKRKEVFDALDRIEEKLTVGVPLNDLTTEQKIQLVNDQEFVNATLIQAAEDSRVICSHVVKTGSHRRTPRCATVLHMRNQRERSKHETERFFRSHLKPPEEP